MRKFNWIFLIWWMAVSSGSSFAWSSTINNIFSSKVFLNLLAGPELNLFETITTGAQMAMDECSTAFFWDRWNCPITDFSKKKKQPLTKEQAVIQSMLSAGIFYAVAKNCSQGLIPSCKCNDTKVTKQYAELTTPYTKTAIYEYLIKKNETIIVDFILKGCAANINFAESVSKNILDKQMTGDDIQDKINLHNNNIGRELAQKSMKRKCRCHGMSGSCTMQTCWNEFPSFSKIAKQIRTKYRHAVKVKYINDNRRFPQNFENKTANKIKTALIFLDNSQDLCFANNKTGWPGTKDRQCSRDNLTSDSKAKRKSCKHLCKKCGYEVSKIEKVKTWNCNCKFNWCCNVVCQNCTKTVNEYFCT